MSSRVAAHRGLLVSLIILPLTLTVGRTALPPSTQPVSAAHGVVTAPLLAVAATARPTAQPLSTTTPASDTTSSTDTFGGGGDLLDDELALLSGSAPDLSSSTSLAMLPPINGSVANLATNIIGLLGRVQASSLSSRVKSTLTGRLENLTLQLAPALDTKDQIDTLRGQENLLLQARLDAQTAIDKLNASIQVNLDSLRVNVETTVSADVVASVGSISVTVSGSADTIQAQLGARVNRLLVNVITDLDVLHIATLHATAHVDTARLNVNLFAQVKKLRLDLELLLAALKVSVHADVSASIAAVASLTVSLATEIDGLKADLAANIDAKLAGLDSLLRGLIGSLNTTLATASRTLQIIQAQVGAAASTLSRVAGALPSTGRGGTALPADALSVPAVERQLLGLVGQVESAAVPAATRLGLLSQLGRLAMQLQGAETLSRRSDTQNAGLNTLLQSKINAVAAIDKIGADLQINLDQLETNVNAAVNANVDASLGGITLTVKAGANEIRADLGAKANRLLVDITADLDVIKVITLHARAHVDAQRLEVTLHALVTKLTLDLTAVLKDLKVLAKANVSAALAAEARLRANITAQVSGVRASVLAGIDGRITLQLKGIAATEGALRQTLSSVSASLAGIGHGL